MRDRKGRRAPTRVDDIIKRVMKNLDMPEDTALRGRVMNSWDRISQDASKHSRPLRFQGNVMVVSVSNSGWMNELALRKNELLRRLERDVGEGIVKDIRFQLEREGGD
jgi:predicted nucleic acid-binding Zn ribbon protein